MRDMDVFGHNYKTNREKRINALLDRTEICEYCVLKDSLCDCEHCDEAYTKYLEVNNKTEEEDLKESGFVDKEEVEELDDLDRLYEFNEGEVLRINIWFADVGVKPIECLDRLRLGTKLQEIPLRVSEKAPWHWSFILEDNTKLSAQDITEIKVVIEKRLIELSKAGITKLSRFMTNDYKSEYL